MPAGMVPVGVAGITPGGAGWELSMATRNRTRRSERTTRASTGRRAVEVAGRRRRVFVDAAGVVVGVGGRTVEVAGRPRPLVFVDGGGVPVGLMPFGVWLPRPDGQRYLSTEQAAEAFKVPAGVLVDLWWKNYRRFVLEA